MAFPSSPTLGQQYTQDGRTWQWDGVAWEILALAGPAGPPGVISATAPLALASGVLTINLSNYLPVSGGTLDANSTIDASTTTEASTFSGSGLDAALSANPSENSTFRYSGLQVQNFSGTMSVTPTGLTFPNSSTQTIAFPGFTGYAPLASPTFTGTPLSTTAAVDTNTTQIATTAYVVAQAAAATPLVDGTAAVGTSLRYARADHVHPTDTSRAALASPTFTGTPLSTTAAVDTNTTQIATTAYVVGQGYAKLASPTFTGTPTLPTGTIGVTQSPGNNTTALATTAFVTAAVPAFGAQADINEPLSSTKAASIENVREMLLSPAYQMFYQGLGVNGTSGAGAAVNANSGRWKEYVGPNSAVAGHAKGVFDTNAGSIGFAGYQRGANLTSRNWSKKVWMAGRCMIGHFSLTTYNGSANSFARISLGGYTAIGAGDMTSSIRGIGWRLQGGGSSVLELQVSNGTTVTTVSSSFTPTLKQCFDWEIYSDGAGNVSLSVNDSQVATTTAGPTGTATSGLYMEGIDATASSTSAFILNNLGTKIYYGI